MIRVHGILSTFPCGPYLPGKNTALIPIKTPLVYLRILLLQGHAQLLRQSTTWAPSQDFRISLGYQDSMLKVSR